MLVSGWLQLRDRETKAECVWQLHTHTTTVICAYRSYTFLMSHTQMCYFSSRTFRMWGLLHLEGSILSPLFLLAESSVETWVQNITTSLNHTLTVADSQSHAQFNAEKTQGGSLFLSAFLDVSFTLHTSSLHPFNVIYCLCNNSLVFFLGDKISSKQSHSLYNSFFLALLVMFT